MERITISTTQERLIHIELLLEKKTYPDRSTFINTAIDDLLFKHKTNQLVIFMYWIGIPLFLFLISVGLTLYASSIFFYIITGIAGIYLMIFIFLFYNKYGGFTWRND